MNNFIKSIHKQKFISIDNLRFLKSPTEFYDALLSFLMTSQEAHIACLYAGVDKLTKSILKAIKDRKLNFKSTKMILDANRVKRTPGLQKTIEQYDLMDVIHYYQGNNWPLLPLIKEFLSVLHSKLFIFDEYVLITGANCSDTYMVDRLDRYAIIKDRNLALDLKYLFQCILDNNQYNVPMINFTHVQGDTLITRFDSKSEIDILKFIVGFNFDDVTLSTGYLNFPKKYMEILKNTKIRLVVPAPNTSTYCQTKILEKNVVEGYAYMSYKTKKQLPRSEIWEFKCETLSFHCKGIWAFKKDFCCMVIGSSNFNNRSCFRDIETSFLIVSRDVEIIKNIKEEHDYIMGMCEEKSLKDLEEGKFSFFSKIGFELFNQFL